MPSDPNDLPTIPETIEGPAAFDSHDYVSHLRPGLSFDLQAHAEGLRGCVDACSPSQGALSARLSICAQLMDEAANALLNPPIDPNVPAFLRKQA